MGWFPPAWSPGQSQQDWVWVVGEARAASGQSRLSFSCFPHIVFKINVYLSPTVCQEQEGLAWVGPLDHNQALGLRMTWGPYPHLCTPDL